LQKTKKGLCINIEYIGWAVVSCGFKRSMNQPELFFLIQNNCFLGVVLSWNLHRSADKIRPDLYLQKVLVILLSIGKDKGFL